MIHIDHLRVRLPARFQTVAQDFPRYLEDALGAVNVVCQGATMKQVGPITVRLTPNADLRAAAHAVARELARFWQGVAR